MSSSRPSNLMRADAYLLPVSKDSKIDKALLQPIFFQFLPEIIGDSEDVNYEDIGGDAIGRAETFSIYKGGTGRIITIHATFAAVGSEDSDSFDTKWVQSQVMRIRALTRPLYDRETIFNGTSSSFFAPPLVLFSYGTRFVNIPVVIKRVEAKQNDESKISVFNALPEVMEVDIEMKTNYPYGYVPGYINYVKLYGDRTAGATASETNGDFRQLSFGTASTTTEDISGKLQQFGATTNDVNYGYVRVEEI